MPSDRSSPRNDYPNRGRGALVWVISAIAAGFVMENVFAHWFESGLFENLFSLSIKGLSNLHFWQVLSYGFLHSAGEPFQVLIVAFNLLCLYILGRELEGLLGTTRFLALYLGGLAMGALTWVPVHYSQGGVLMGAWPGIVALLTLFACLNAEQRITLLVFFVAPVTVKPKHLVWGLLTIDICGLAFWELRGLPSPLGFAHSARLGGMLAGYLYFFIVHQREWRNPDGRADIELPAWLRKKKKAAAVAATTGKFTVNLTNRENLRSEVDRILDKINSEGLNSLTPEEKRLLDDARNQLPRH